MKKVLCFGAKVNADFRYRLYHICQELGWEFEHANWLMACMAFESGETFSPSVRNAAGSGATGLIQFMPATAKGLGTSTMQLAAMSATEQLDYVMRYFRPYAKRIHTLQDMYMAILMPKFIGASLDAIVFQSNTVAYRQNKGLDKDRKGYVTKRDAALKVQAKYDKGMKAPFAYVIIPPQL